MGAVAASASPTPMGSGGLFASAGIPYLDNGVISLSSNNSVYLKTIDLIFLVSGAAALAFAFHGESLGLGIIGAILILAGVAGVAFGWD